MKEAHRKATGDIPWRWQPTALFFAVLLAGGAAACEARLGASSHDGSGSGNGNGNGNGNGVSGAGASSGDPAAQDLTDGRLEARVWRLTPEQYNSEVQRLFPGAPAVDLPRGSSEFTFSNIAEGARIDFGNASQFIDAARLVGSWAAAQGAPAARCDDFGTPNCVETFLGWFPEAAYRRAELSSFGVAAG